MQQLISRYDNFFEKFVTKSLGVSWLFSNILSHQGWTSYNSLWGRTLVWIAEYSHIIRKTTHPEHSNFKILSPGQNQEVRIFSKIYILVPSKFDRKWTFGYKISIWKTKRSWEFKNLRKSAIVCCQDWFLIFFLSEIRLLCASWLLEFWKNNLEMLLAC